MELNNQSPFLFPLTCNYSTTFPKSPHISTTPASSLRLPMTIRMANQTQHHLWRIGVLHTWLLERNSIRIELVTKVRVRRRMSQHRRMVFCKTLIC
uniref:Uncharacterized protein n=1 Tax=Kalanchoe fedtschenkoi TaxID=63787 RepID=A0A7N0RB19_KALFE